MLDPISSNQAIGTATRPWITTPTARLSRIWAPTLDYSSTWGNWNFNLGPNDWDFLSISLLLTLTKTDQHSLPPHIWPQELRQGLLNSSDGVLSLIPVMVRMAPQPTRLHTTHHLSPCYPMEGMRSLRHCTPYQWNTLFPPTTHGIPYWTARVCITRSNETPQSLPLISLTSPEPTRH